jgi:hypothetical protein
MIYRKLLEKLLLASEEQLDHNITIYNFSNDEYYPILSIENVDDDVLENHIVLKFGEEVN